MKPHQDCQITEPSPLQMEEVIVHTSYFRPHIMTTDDLGLADLLREKSDIEVARLVNLGLLLRKGISDQDAGFDTITSLNDAGLAWVASIVAAIRSPSAVPANGAGREALEANPAAKFVMWALMEGSWQGADIDGGAAQDKAAELGLIVEVPYDPAKHGQSDCSEPGDSWFVPSETLLRALASSPVVGPPALPRPHRATPGEGA